MTFIVYIQVKAGWVVGFGIPVGLMSFFAIMFFLGSCLYKKVKPNKSLLTSLAQAIMAAGKKIDIYPCLPRILTFGIFIMALTLFNQQTKQGM